jgi:transcriptional regulator with XRE-family HTH domain
MNIELQALGESIRRLRRSLKMSQEKLAERCGLHRTYLSDVERGNRNLSFLSLLAVARGLDSTISELSRDIRTGGAHDPATMNRELVVRSSHQNRPEENKSAYIPRSFVPRNE